MQNKRQHKRFKLDLLEINGRMILAQKIEILDISLGGLALKTDRRLNVGKEYLVKLSYKEKSLDVKGIIVRCVLSNIEERNGEGVVIYTAGMMFKDASSNKISDFINLIELDTKDDAPEMADRRQEVRFCITTPCEKKLSFPAQFTVKIISQTGMLIRTEQALDIESLIPMELALGEINQSISFTGRIASCQQKGDAGLEHYEIGVEFRDLTDKDRTLLKTSIDYLTIIEAGAGAKKTDHETGNISPFGEIV